MMQRYLNHALLFDFLISILLSGVIYYLRPYFVNFIQLPTDLTVIKSMDSIVKVATPLIGFLLTIVGVIVTFKNNFDALSKTQVDNKPGLNIESDPAVPPTTTVFDKKLPKREVFYKSGLPQQVMKVFLSAVYEFSLIVFIFLILQSEIFILPVFWSVLITFQGFILLLLGMARSLYIYRLFLNVHTNNDPPAANATIN